MRLDIALVYRDGGGLALDDDLGGGEALLQVSKLKFEAIGDILRRGITGDR